MRSHIRLTPAQHLLANFNTHNLSGTSPKALSRTRTLSRRETPPRRPRDNRMARSLHALVHVDSISTADDPYVSASETQPSFAASGLRSPSQTSNNIRRAFSVRGD
ncbi:hypothetical protein BGY98DRAFT_1064622 [Russula aff. rugulosa BPL654]|nr:hypothetical protein BGY98DRAFT_1064622 [Russula aff. rugulosa BPL654]